MRLGEEAGPTLEWLTAHGITFDALPTPFMTQSTTRMSPVGGGWELVETLTRRAKELGATYFYETTAQSLVLDDVRRGVRTCGPTPAGVLGGRVVLACGGFEGNTEMMARYMGPSALNTRPVARGGHYNKGEGIEMALAVGAAGAGNFGLFHAEPIDPRSGVAEAAIFAFPYGILVNREGERFVERGARPGRCVVRARDAPHPGPAGRHRLHDPATSRASRSPTSRPASAPTSRPSLPTRSRSSPTRLGRPRPGALAPPWPSSTPPARTGGFDHTMPDGLATDGLAIGKSHWSRPIAEGPFVAYPIIAANVFTFGGLRIDADAHVVNRSGEAIPGLLRGRRDHRHLLLQLHRIHLGAARGGLRPHRRRQRGREGRLTCGSGTRASPCSTTSRTTGTPSSGTSRRVARTRHRDRLPRHGRRAPTRPTTPASTSATPTWPACTGAVRAGGPAGAARGLRRVPHRHDPRHRLRGGPAIVDIPVVAFGNTSVGYASALGNCVGIVHFIPELRDQIRRNMRSYGFGGLRRADRSGRRRVPRHHGRVRRARRTHRRVRARCPRRHRRRCERDRARARDRSTSSSPTRASLASTTSR